MLVSVFVRAESFCKKKINRLELVPIASIHYTTDVYLYQPAYETYIYTHLFLFVILCENFFFLWESFWIFLVWASLFICDHLWESLLFMRIILSLSYLWKSFFYENSFLFVRIYFLWEIFFFLITLFLFVKISLWK